MNWTTTINYSENGEDFQQEFTAPHLPRKGDLIIAIFDRELVRRVIFEVVDVSFSNVSKSITINLKS